ncbi:MAG: carboxymuconolactone decarboxylase family protein [Acidimicrobiales bacterium]|nr:carboxymuconolactone decarboxylase family protein [Acidimicrobiales bacterium]
MTHRIDVPEVAPDLFQTVMGLEAHLRGQVDPTLLELIKLRASIINECAFCVDMHSTDAMKAGERPERLFAVAAWRESPSFTDAERAALALTDAVTRLGAEGVPDDVWGAATEVFDQYQLAHLVGAIAMINFWNRMMIAVRTPPLYAVEA